MTYTPGTWTCDRCGEPVAENSTVTLSTVVAISAGDRYQGGYIAHYHAECWGTVRAAVWDVVAEHRLARAPSSPAALIAEFRARNWKSHTTVREREHAVLSALGEDRLTIRDLTQRVDDAWPESNVYQSIVTSIVTRLLKAGDLDREPDTRGRRLQYRYFRRTELRGPIADLDHVYHDEAA